VPENCTTLHQFALILVPPRVSVLHSDPHLHFCSSVGSVWLLALWRPKSYTFLPGCRGKPAWQNKNRMALTSPLSGFASRLRALINAPTEWGNLCADPTFCGLALELFQLQMQSNPLYRRFVDGRNLEQIAHWSQIPAAPTSGFKEFEISCLLPSERRLVFQSSGTTGQLPSCHYHSDESLGLYEDSAWAWFESSLLRGRTSDSFGSIVILTPPPCDAPHSSLVHMLEVVRQRMPSAISAYTGKVTEQGSWELDFVATRNALETASSTNPSALVLGTAFSFVHLLDLMSAHKLRFKMPAGSLAMETGGYKGRSRSISKAELHKLIRSQLGIGADCLACEYGMSELSSQAYDHEPRNGGPSLVIRSSPRLLRFPPWTRVQIISPETGQEAGLGQIGLIRVFDLANTFSVMAIQTEDLGIRQMDGFQLVGRAAFAENRGCSLMAAV